KFISPRDLDRKEADVFRQRDTIVRLVGGPPRAVKAIVISETMRPDALGGADADGLWEAQTGRIIIKRSQLSSVAAFAGTLLHEIAHARSGCSDVNREFELMLTEFLGLAASRAALIKSSHLKLRFYDRLLHRLRLRDGMAQ
ncbi:MAG TPA: hypothetical protein VNE83_00690, partial [Terriglobales bacterium]|nr:hypothetical protein [Terriglobales bacterium]